MQQPVGDSRVAKPEISRYMLAMFDVLGFSRWMKSVGLRTVLDSYHLLIENAVVRSNEKGGLTQFRLQMVPSSR